MILTDVNQTLHRPEGFDVMDVRGEGAYLRVEFNRSKYVDDPTDRCTGRMVVGWDAVVLYLNDQGREVLRTEWFTKIAPLPVSVPPPAPPKTFWQEFKEDMRVLFTVSWRMS